MSDDRESKISFRDEKKYNRAQDIRVNNTIRKNALKQDSIVVGVFSVILLVLLIVSTYRSILSDSEFLTFSAFLDMLENLNSVSFDFVLEPISTGIDWFDSILEVLTSLGTVLLFFVNGVWYVLNFIIQLISMLF